MGQPVTSCLGIPGRGEFLAEILLKKLGLDSVLCDYKDWHVLNWQSVWSDWFWVVARSFFFDVGYTSNGLLKLVPYDLLLAIFADRFCNQNRNRVVPCSFPFRFAACVYTPPWSGRSFLIFWLRFFSKHGMQNSSYTCHRRSATSDHLPPAKLIYDLQRNLQTKDSFDSVFCNMESNLFVLQWQNPLAYYLFGDYDTGSNELLVNLDHRKKSCH